MRRIIVFAVFSLVWFSVCAATVQMHCWIVGNGDGISHHHSSDVSNLVAEVNAIYSQVRMKFTISSLSFTNSTYLANVDLENSRQYNVLCSLQTGTGGLELYFVPVLIGATAFYTDGGIVVGPAANSRTVAHEIGHVCGLTDIYDQSHDGNLVVEDVPNLSRMPNDWGWYPSSVQQSHIIKRLLMYGGTSDSKADLSYGDVYGANYTSTWNVVGRKWDDHWHFENVAVGFKAHGNRCPTSL